ncbi:protein FAM162B isoform X2 [Apis florea]|nr:protein FAM162B isoform X2 [Apis florea]XP_031773047.1 protein FAM162B isoform X2 [Apis florea]XP_031773048.1 protein FAM162B isoform X2 [Apis florea]
MFCTRLIRQFKCFKIRQLHTTFVKNENKPVTETPKAKTETPKAANISQAEKEAIEFVSGETLHTLSNLDKRILVWVKRFPSMDQVPKQVSIRTIQLAHTKARIKVCFYMMAFAIIGSILAVISGKRDVAAGKNIITERQKWYDKVKEQARKEAEMAEKKEK